MAKPYPEKLLPGGRGKPAVIPTDEMMMGVHSSLAVASKHKKLVSGVLHLKKETLGHRSNPSAYHTGKRAAFKPKQNG